jgi:hypothetical protein
MTAGPDIQPDDAEGTAPGFEKDHQPVPTVDPDIYFDDPPPPTADFELEPFLDFLLMGATTRLDIADKVLNLAFLMPRVLRRPKTFTELGNWMDVSSTTAKARLEAKKPVFIAEFRALLERPPIDED